MALKDISLLSSLQLTLQPTSLKFQDLPFVSLQTDHDGTWITQGKYMYHYG